MRYVENRPTFRNNLADEASPYLQVHSQNPVFWYPWGEAAFAAARAQNKPIFLSIGFFSCYWCHSEEEEVFNSLSVASLMNRSFINIKVDREQLPHIDDIYMVTRQLMKQEGGWPNNLFLTPELKPFYAGGALSTQETQEVPSFPRLMEWIISEWATNEAEIRAKAEDNVAVILPFLTHAELPEAQRPKIEDACEQMLEVMKQQYDAQFGGFFQAPKFPRENFVQFLLDYHAHTGSGVALEMATKSLRHMAAGAIYDHVGGGFHRYAIDKQWYAPRFEKMLTTQALLARNYVDAARLSQSPYMTDMALSLLDFVSGPMTTEDGAFYSAIDSKVGDVEGGYYVWDSEDIQDLLEEPEIEFFVNFYALADVPTFPGHRDPEGQTIVARKPLDLAARDAGISYLQASAMSAHVLNKLLEARNKRPAPLLDNKIIVGWNGLMIDAFAHAGLVFGRPSYIERAQKAAQFILDNAFDNDGKLYRQIMAGNQELAATLEDYAYLMRGLISLQKAEPSKEGLEVIVSLGERVEELFGSADEPGYFFNEEQEQPLWVRLKNDEDTALPNANAVMLQNWVDLHVLTKEQHYLDRAMAMVGFFSTGDFIVPEFGAMVAASLNATALFEGRELPVVKPLSLSAIIEERQESVSVAASLEEDILKVELTMALGWHINMGSVANTELVGYKLEVETPGVELGEITGPPPRQDIVMGEFLRVYDGRVTLVAKLKKPANIQKVNFKLRFLPCQGTIAFPMVEKTFSV